MSHSHRNHTYKSNTHKNRSNLKTKYNDNKKQRSVFGVYTEVGITQRILGPYYMSQNNTDKHNVNILSVTWLKFTSA